MLAPWLLQFSVLKLNIGQSNTYKVLPKLIYFYLTFDICKRAIHYFQFASPINIRACLSGAAVSHFYPNNSQWRIPKRPACCFQRLNIFLCTRKLSRSTIGSTALATVHQYFNAAQSGMLFDGEPLQCQNGNYRTENGRSTLKKIAVLENASNRK